MDAKNTEEQLTYAEGIPSQKEDIVNIENEDKPQTQVEINESEDEKAITNPNQEEVKLDTI